MAGRPKIEKNIENYEDENKVLKSKIDTLEALVNQLLTQSQKPTETIVEKVVEQPVLVKKTMDINRWVKIIHLEQRTRPLTTHIELTNRTIDFTDFGDEIYVTFMEFQELSSKYKTWFENHIIGLGEEEDDLIEKYHLPTMNDVVITKSVLSNLESLSLEQLKSLYNSVGSTHKNVIVRKWLYGFYELKELKYRDYNKVYLLNELTNGALKNVLLDLQDILDNNK